MLAGVVDKKTPRYCLLGDTMQRAVHLEETGEGELGFLSRRHRCDCGGKQHVQNLLQFLWECVCVCVCVRACVRACVHAYVPSAHKHAQIHTYHIHTRVYVCVVYV